MVTTGPEVVILPRLRHYHRLLGSLIAPHGLEMIDNTRSKARRVGFDGHVVCATDTRRQING